MENFGIMGAHRKIKFFERGVHEKPIYTVWLEQFADVRGGLAIKRRSVFFRLRRVDTLMQTIRNGRNLFNFKCIFR